MAIWLGFFVELTTPLCAQDTDIQAKASEVRRVVRIAFGIRWNLPIGPVKAARPMQLGGIYRGELRYLSVFATRILLFALTVSRHHRCLLPRDWLHQRRLRKEQIRPGRSRGLLRRWPAAWSRWRSTYS